MELDMPPKMPRGAVPASRSELATTQRYMPDGGAELLVPSGQFPSSNQELVAASPYRPQGKAPESFTAWPIGLAAWTDGQGGSSLFAEEAFAKACAEPKVLIPREVVADAVRRCGSSNFAGFMQTSGFNLDDCAYVNGPFSTLDWTDIATLNGAIAAVGPVKLGIASLALAAGRQGRIALPAHGWAVCGLPTGLPEDICVSLFGYGPLTTLVDQFARHGINVDAPAAMPTGLCYALFAHDTIGIIDRQSLLNITGEAWVRIPTTMVKPSSR
jgi:hypothetical protein